MATVTRAQRVVDTLMRADPQFVEMCKILYGPAVDGDLVYADVFGKSNPGVADMHVPTATTAPPGRRRKALALAALGSVGAGGVVAGKDLLRSTGRARLLPAAALAGDVLAGGEIATNAKTLFRRGQPVQKAALRGLVRGHLTQHRRLVRETLEATRSTNPPKRPSGGAPKPPARAVAKSTVDADWAGTFSKFDDDKRIALGWASVCKVNGQPIIDRQGDYIDADDLEDAVYAYVQRSRVGGDMHDRVVGKSDGRGLWFGLYGVDPAPDAPRKVADLVESVVITKAKKDAMGLPDDYPEGWWVGFRYHDDEIWKAIKTGERTGFSVHGSGLRKAVDYDQLMGAR